MNLSEWVKREDLQLEWKHLWETNSTLKAGLEVLKEIALPTEIRCQPGTDLIQFNALSNARREGYYDCIRNIHGLKEVRVKSQELPEPWEGVKAQD
jgi:hypothetical protein